MAGPSFKSDESFLEKLAVGATGTKVTIERLTQLGFQPIELERGSTGYKLWKKIKIKRVRVPDILCLRTGLRFEARGKTSSEISMSHSTADPARAWNVGLGNEDYVVIVECEKASASIVDWRAASPVHFIRVGDLAAAFKKKRIKVTKPKGVEEGSEIRVIWPSRAAALKSKVIEVTATSLKLEAIEGERKQRFVLNGLRPLCKVGETVEQNQIVAAVVPVVVQLKPTGDVGEKHFREKLASKVLSERYAAAKALRFRGYAMSAASLKSAVQDDEEDIYVRLECAAALATHDDALGWDFLAQSLQSEFTQVQLETVIVISEIPKPRSEQMLIATLADQSKHEEVRAGAAWGLGQFRSKAASEALVSVFDETRQEIRTEAARALLRIAPGQLSDLLQLMRSTDTAKRDGIAWVLARSGEFDPKELLRSSPDDNLRRWTGYILGFGKERFLESALEEVSKSDPEVYFAASVLWQLLESWIHDLKEYG